MAGLGRRLLAAWEAEDVGPAEPALDVALAALLVGRCPAEAVAQRRAWLARLEAAPIHDEDERATRRALLVNWRLKLAEDLAWAGAPGEGLALLDGLGVPAGEPLLRVWVAVARAKACLFLGRLAEADAALGEAERLAAGLARSGQTPEEWLRTSSTWAWPRREVDARLGRGRR